MTVPMKRRSSSSRKRRASHFALKPKQLIKADGEVIPHSLKKALSLKKDIKTRTK